MKIGVIRRRFASSGGAELYVQRLVGGLLARGHHRFLEGAGEELFAHEQAAEQAATDGRDVARVGVWGEQCRELLVAFVVSLPLENRRDRVEIRDRGRPRRRRDASP